MIDPSWPDQLSPTDRLTARLGMWWAMTGLNHAMRIAAMDGNTAEMNRYLDEGADINSTDGSVSCPRLLPASTNAKPPPHPLC